MYKSNTDLPSNWVWTSLAELMDRLQYGFTAKANLNATGPKFLRITDIKKGSVDWATVPYCEIHANDIEKYRLLEGDIVFARSGSIEKACMVIDPPEAIFASYLIRGRPLLPSVNIWIKYFVQSSEYLSQIGAAAAGIGMQNVNAKKIGSVSIPIAPLSEQSRITSKVRSLQSRSSMARKALEAIPPLLKKFRQSVLSSAFRGDLTADWRTQNPDVEPAAKLLERIRKERRKHWEEAEQAKMKAKNKTQKNDKWKKKYKEPEPVDTTNLPKLPEGWCWAKTDELFSFVTSGSRGWAKYYSSEGDIFLRIGNQERKSINLDLSNIQYVQPPEGTEGTRTQVKKDDILISITADIGIISIVSGKLPQSYINQHIALARPVQIVEAKFLAWYLASIDGQKQLQNLKKGMTKAGLRLDDIRSVIVPLPSINEQKYIVSTIENKIESIKMTSNRLSYCSSHLKLLDQSILAKAFCGKLVPQDPNDEPASQLLKRIKQEKASREAAKKKSRKPNRKKATHKDKATEQR